MISFYLMIHSYTIIVYSQIANEASTFSSDALKVDSSIAVYVAVNSAIKNLTFQVRTFNGSPCGESSSTHVS